MEFKKFKKKQQCLKNFGHFCLFLKQLLFFQSATFGVVFLMPHYNRAKWVSCQETHVYLCEI